MNATYLVGIIISSIGIILLNKTYKIKLLKRSKMNVEKTNSINKNENSIEKIENVKNIEHITVSDETTNVDIFDIRIKTKPKKSKKIQGIKIKEKENSIIQEEINQKTPTKNRYLHEADDFGTMKKGVIIEHITYVYDKQEKHDEFTIN